MLGHVRGSFAEVPGNALALSVPTRNARAFDRPNTAGNGRCRSGRMRLLFRVAELRSQTVPNAHRLCRAARWLRPGPVAGAPLAANMAGRCRSPAAVRRAGPEGIARGCGMYRAPGL